MIKDVKYSLEANELFCQYFEAISKNIFEISKFEI